MSESHRLSNSASARQADSSARLTERESGNMAQSHGQGQDAPSVATPVLHGDDANSKTPPRVANTHAPAMAQLNSRPPTTRQDAVTTTLIPPSAEPRRDDASSAQSVRELCAIIDQLKIDLSEARTTTAHYKLQYNMLRMDSAETQNRMLVELDMAQREIEVFQIAEERRKSELLSPTLSQAEVTTANATIINQLHAERIVMLDDIATLRIELSQAEFEKEEKDSIIDAQSEEIVRLRERIRKNREHMNGLLDNIYESTGSPQYWPGTPMRHAQSQQATPRTIPRRNIMMPTSQPRGNQNFEALLLADKLISQETVPTPVTPKTVPTRKQAGHTRGVHSLSSLPSTPRRQIIPTSRLLQTPPQSSVAGEPYSGSRSKPSSASRPPPFSLTAGSDKRRRGSSDSTISATSDDEKPSRSENGKRADTIRASKAPQEELISESQASQAAISMLRRTPVQQGGSFSAATSVPNKSAVKSGKKDLSQTKLTGRISKPRSAVPSAVKSVQDADKRRLVSHGDSTGSPTKKSRTVATGAEPDYVGLGIGLSGSPK